MSEDPTEAAHDLALLRALEADHSTMDKLEGLLDQFNVFRVLKLGDHEIRHSNVLGWLLDKNENHGLGDRFLRSWLMRVLRDTGSAADLTLAQKFQHTPFDRVEVRREWKRFDETRRLDLLVEIKTTIGDWVVAIENKVWASQSPKQLESYRSAVEKDYPPPAERSFIFLTAFDEEPDEQVYLPASYTQVAEELVACVRDSQNPSSEGSRFLIQHYIDLIKSSFMPHSPVSELAKQLYANHQRAIDLIIEHREDSLRRLTDKLAKRLSDYAPQNSLRMARVSRAYVRFAPESWWKEINLQEHRDWPTLFCEFDLTGRAIKLKCVVRPGGKVRLPTVIPHLPNIKNTTAKGWLKFYLSKARMLEIGQPTDNELEEIAKELWAWCQTQVEGAEFQNVATATAALIANPPKT